MRASMTGRKCRIRPCTGHAAASPSAQWCDLRSASKRRTAYRFRSSPLRPRHALEHAPHPARAFAAGRALAAALVLVEVGDAGHGLDDVGRLVEHDDGRRAETGLELDRLSKSMVRSLQRSAGMSGMDEPPGMTASRLFQPPRTPPQCSSMSWRIGMPISSSTTHGLFTWPEIWNSLVPVLLGRPRAANQVRRAAGCRPRPRCSRRC